MPKFKVDIYVEEIYVTTLFVEAVDAQEADDKALGQLTIDTDVDELDD